MRISIDAMGGDFAPREIVAGTLRAAKSLQGIKKLILVGDETAIQTELKKHKGAVPPCIEIVHAPEVVEMGDSPAVAIPSISCRVSPASSRVLRAASAWSCSWLMCGITPRSVVSAAPTIAMLPGFMSCPPRQAERVAA